MHFKIDFQLSQSVLDKQFLKEKIAFDLGMFILNNSDFIKDEELEFKGKRGGPWISDDEEERSMFISKDIMVFTDAVKFKNTLSSSERFDLLDFDFN